MMMPIKVYDNMNYKKIDNVNFEYGFKILLLYIMLKNYKCDSPNYPPISCFHPT
jgi:hypothetical protein